MRPHPEALADAPPIEFLVASPAEALDRVLQRIHKDLLERTVARQDEDIHRPPLTRGPRPGPAGTGTYKLQLAVTTSDNQILHIIRHTDRT